MNHIKVYFSRWYNIWFAVITLVFVLLHIPVIVRPPTDSHSWRQTDTAAVARNYQEESANIFQPRIDMRGNLSGITGMEFPVYNYLIFIANSLFGFHQWTGRIISLLFSITGLFFFYEFIKNRIDIKLALISVVVLCVFPVFLIYSKNIQPDIMMLTLALASFYFAQKYSKHNKQSFLVLCILSFSLACLVKIPAIIFLPVLMMILPLKQILKQKKLSTFIAATLGILAIFAWYGYSNYLSSHFGLGQYFYGDYSFGTTLNIVTKASFWLTTAKYIFISNYVVGVFGIFVLLGVAGFIAKKNYLPIVWLLCSSAFLVLFASKSYYHNYYSLIILPSLALVISQGIYWVSKNLKKDNPNTWRFTFITIIVILSLAVPLYVLKKINDTHLTDLQKQLPGLEAFVDKNSDKSSLFVVNGSGDPTMLYFAHRKGWSLSDSDLSRLSVQDMKSMQIKYLLIYQIQTSLSDNLIQGGAELVDQNNQMVLFRLK